MEKLAALSLMLSACATTAKPPEIEVKLDHLILVVRSLEERVALLEADSEEAAERALWSEARSEF